MERILDTVEKIVDHGINLEKDLEEWKSEFRVLKRREIDIDSRIDTEVRSGQVVKEEVKGYVQKMEEDIQGIEERVHSGVPVYERVSVDKLVREKIEVVKKIYDSGNFSEVLVIERAPPRGIIIPTGKIEGEISTKDEILKHLTDDQVGMIGVCGIGGVGKTTIMKHFNNDLLSEGRFQKVIWVTVSYPLNALELQKKIALAMGKTLPEDVGQMMRATALMDILGRVSFVLILDDVWEKFSLKDVGIPEPVQNKSKVVITSSSIEVCNYLDCKIVKVQPLSPQESLNLFLEKVGRDVLHKVSGLEETLQLIVEECKGLPLAIVVIAGSLKGEYDIAEWRNALNELRQCVRSVKCVGDEIFGWLRFSYGRLRSLQIQECFLYCSLFPEDYEFSGKKLIEDWIDEGLIVIDELGSKQAAYDRGRAILNRLQQNCLLEICFKRDRVKMHNVVRDMAIKSIGLGCGYMVKAGMKLKKVPKGREWVRDLKKVSLMANDISKISAGLSLKCLLLSTLSKIPAGLAPKCLLLSTLILSNNPNLSKISSSFFKDMAGLKVLDLSGTGVKALPNSISNLVNLSTLRLRECRSLKYLPSLARLGALKKLDLHQAGIEVVPQGMEMLVSFEYLDLNCQNLKEIPKGILSKLSSLQYLVVRNNWRSTSVKINLEEVARLKELEIVEWNFDDKQDFNYLMREFKNFQSSVTYKLLVGTKMDHQMDVDDPKYKCRLIISECDIGEEYIVLPDKLQHQHLRIHKCENIRSSLNKIALLENATKLGVCIISDCEEIEYVVELDSSSSSSSSPVLDKLEHLYLLDLPRLWALVRVEGVATLPCVFSNLKTLDITRCSGIRKLLPVELLQALQNLEKITVWLCNQIEEIIASSDSDASSSDKITSTFPKLRVLDL